jgi:hypothetical protein
MAINKHARGDGNHFSATYTGLFTDKQAISYDEGFSVGEEGTEQDIQDLKSVGMNNTAELLAEYSAGDGLDENEAKIINGFIDRANGSDKIIGNGDKLAKQADKEAGEILADHRKKYGTKL